MGLPHWNPTMFVIALLATSLSAPVPKEKPAEMYFPIVVGTKRVLEVTRREITSEITEEVTKVSEKDGVYKVTVEGKAINGSARGNVFEVSAKKIRLVEEKSSGGGTPLDKTMIDLGVKAGEVWTREFELPGLTPKMPSFKVVYTFTQGKEEEVEVPAGKFKAISMSEESKSQKSTRWYAPEVGLVKEEYTLIGTKSPSVSVTVLKSFTPGKAKDEKKEKEKEKK